MNPHMHCYTIPNPIPESGITVRCDTEGCDGEQHFPHFRYTDVPLGPSSRSKQHKAQIKLALFRKKEEIYDTGQESSIDDFQ
jgi:hypothetical protein